MSIIKRLSFSYHKSLLLLLGVPVMGATLIIAGCQSSQLVTRDLTADEWQTQLQLTSTQEAAALQSLVYNQIETQWLDWFDQARQRAVPALLFTPEKITGKIPLVVFSHGLGGARDRYAYLGQYWARKGVASLHVQHVGSDRQVWQGSRWTLALRLQKAAGDKEALDRVADVKFALNQFLATPAAATIDQQHLVIAGHSYGANTAMLIAGAEVERKHQRIKLQDSRFSAAILISAPPFYTDQTLEDILAKVKIPTLHITTTKDEIKVPGYYSAPEDRLTLFNAIASDYKLLAMFYGGSHNIFTGRRQRPELSTQNQVIKAATQSLSLAFINSEFSGQEQAINEWQVQHKALLANYQKVGQIENY